MKLNKWGRIIFSSTLDYILISLKVESGLKDNAINTFPIPLG